MNFQSDVLIIGAGSGGYSCAFRAAQLGMTVTLVERSDVGGTCLHRGCIPTKALLHVAELADAARVGPEIGVKTVLDGIDMARAQAYKDRIVGRMFSGLKGLVKHHRLDVVRGNAVLTDPHIVEVNGEQHTAQSIVLATGSRPRTIPGIALGRRIVTSDDALLLDVVPDRVIILGGGVIGVEFASMWRSFGAQVTIVEAAPRLVPSDDEWMSTQLTRALRKRGIECRTGVSVVSAEESEDGVVVSLADDTRIDADIVLVAVGRAPQSDELGLERLEIELDNGFVKTDARLRTSIDSVYAVGDLVRGYQLAHRGFQHGIFVAEELAGLGPLAVAEDGVPRVTYSDPQLASVGLTEVSARAKYGAVKTSMYDLAGNAKNQILGGVGGIKLIQQQDGTEPGAVLGIHIIGPRAGELIGEAQLIYNWEATAADVAPHVHAHPTLGEALGEAHLALAGRPLHAHA
ncbi:MAG: dihydrolipoyl dehydrogenase [Rhodococcus sp. (in: high G+C Gram-positive bacteria)]|nr:dihydrolipoyl dehydrogenase [Rhodococcus sp. (in: high G+C Gram-positive bacteria)]